MKLTIFFIFIITCIHCNAQQLSSTPHRITGADFIESAKSTKEAKTLAQKDIIKGNISLIISSNSPIVYASDSAFEQKYQVYFEYIFGCTTINLKRIRAYNKCVSRYLSGKLGRSWKRNLRPNVPGVRFRKKSFIKFLIQHS